MNACLCHFRLRLTFQIQKPCLFTCCNYKYLVITWQQLIAFKHVDNSSGQDNILKFKLSIRLERKGDLSEYKSGMVVCARQAALSVSETTDLLGVSNTTISQVYRGCFKKDKISSERHLMSCRCRIRGQ